MSQSHLMELSAQEPSEDMAGRKLRHIRIPLSPFHEGLPIQQEAARADVERFNRFIRPSLAERFPNDPRWHFERPFDLAQVHAWLDHRASEYVLQQTSGR